MVSRKLKQKPVTCGDCDRQARYFYLVDDGPELEKRPVCGQHYRTELDVDLELWEADHGSFCMECCERVHLFVDRHASLPCLCVRHLAEKMRSDEAIAEKVRAAFKEDKERLLDELISEVRREEKERAKLEQFINKLEA